MSTIIEIYPKCKKPKWMKKGAKCHCSGEGNDILIVWQVGKNAAFLWTEDGKYAHGWESFEKLSKI